MFEQDITLGPGTAEFTSHLFEIIIMLGVAFLLGLWLGWVIWSRFRRTAEQLRREYDSLSATTNSLRAQTDELKSKVSELTQDNKELTQAKTTHDEEMNEIRARMVVLEQDLNKANDEKRELQIKLGLDEEPAVESPEDIAIEFTDDEEQGSDATPLPETPEIPETPDEDTLTEEAVNEVLEDFENTDDNGTELNALGALHSSKGGAALPYLMDDEDEPETPNISGLGLEEEDLLSSTPLHTESENAAAPETPVSPIVEDDAEEAGEGLNINVVSGPKDDLKIVEGIGPKIEEVLFNAGIHTYTELARTPVNRLKDILEEAGSRFSMHDPGTWSAQALLAANGEWDNLKAYQEFLNAGKRPK